MKLSIRKSILQQNRKHFFPESQITTDEVRSYEIRQTANNVLIVRYENLLAW